jgi:hypothetical protein
LNLQLTQNSPLIIHNYFLENLLLASTPISSNPDPRSNMVAGSRADISKLELPATNARCVMISSIVIEKGDEAETSPEGASEKALTSERSMTQVKFLCRKQ